ncbi:MAG TPA: restriction endonuclease subunit S [Spirochaetota bacterium]|nr:restriction endonuclease subunit S [Spirochaetota bacterium]HPI90490.1 restriction endonuclease subunit S [Spirochaetota bacterium]HPR46934.1 restriction endonuclease subunit S [Spirochaetota bacterium]
MKNNDLSIDHLQGISSIHKCFMKSKANIIGVEFHNYKIVKKYQFAFNPNTARMGDKIPIALNLDKPCIVSSIYPVFEIKNESELMPEYLMMWYKRSEFDRFARFHSHGSAREVFGWEEMCNVELPVPSIEKQEEIVAEYNTIVNRIRINEELNRKLEETAQAIYKQWYVDFEFPVSEEYADEIGRPEMEGKPYKSSGGEMVWNEELEKEIPKGWEVITVKKFCKDMKSGGTPNREVTDYWNSKDIPWLKTGEVCNRVLVQSEEYISFKGCQNTFYHDYETKKLKVVSKKATKKKPEECLPYPLLKQDHSYRQGKDARAKESLKMMYVGFSRPTHLLCFACLKENITDSLESYRSVGWEIKDLTQDPVQREVLNG